MFSNANRNRIRFYLGWPAFRVASTTLESAIDALGADVDAQTMVEAQLTAIAAIETEIAALHSIALAEQVEESKLNPRRYQDLRAAGRRECQALAVLLNTQVVRDVFSAGSMGVQIPWG